MDNELFHKQTTGGIVISYLLIILNTIYGIFLMPYIIGKIGAPEYGVYITISAFASALMILDLGTGSAVMRYIAKFRAENDKIGAANYIRIAVLQCCVLALFVLIISVIAYFSLNSIYRRGLTPFELNQAKRLFLFLITTIVGHIFENILNGIITGYNRFIFANGCKFIRLFIRITLTYILLIVFHSSITLVIIDLLLIVSLILVEFIYIRTQLCISLRNTYFDKLLFKDSMKYAMTVFFIAFVSQVSSNLDNVIIGAISSSIAVTTYSVALRFFNMYMQLGSSVSGVMLPTVINSLKNDDERMTATRYLIIKTGRIQFILLGAAMMGFVVLGKKFIAFLMRSNEYGDVYYLSIILMIPILFELCVNICLMILRAKNDLGFYMKTLLFAAILNLTITWTGVYLFNYYAAALGTAISIIIGNLIIMNLYYHKKYRFQMFKIYKEIVSKTWVCIVLSGIMSAAVSVFFEGILSFIGGVIIFLTVYSIALYFYGFNKTEKEYLQKIFSKL